MKKLYTERYFYDSCEKRYYKVNYRRNGIVRCQVFKSDGQILPTMCKMTYVRLSSLKPTRKKNTSFYKETSQNYKTSQGDCKILKQLTENQYLVQKNDGVKITLPSWKIYYKIHQ